MKKLLLISENPYDAEFASEVCNVNGYSLEHLDPSSERAEIKAPEDVLLLLADVAHIDRCLSVRNKLTRGQPPAGKGQAPFIRTHYFVSEGQLADLGGISPELCLENIIVRRTSSNKKVAQCYARILSSDGKEEAKLEHFLSPISKRMSFTFGNSSEKHAALESVSKFVTENGYNNRVAMTVATAADELLMNAMFDAPVSATGRQIYASLDRTAEIPLDGNHQVEMHIAIGNGFVGVTVSDSSGTLDVKSVFKHITKCFKKADYVINEEVAGAGMGLASMFKSGASFYFACKRSKRTEVSVFFDVSGASVKDLKNQFQFVLTKVY